jgi:hypothetical protein
MNSCMSEIIVVINIKIFNLNFIKSVNIKKIIQKSIMENKAALSPDNNTSKTDKRISREILKKKYFLFSYNIKKDTITIGNILET